MGAASSLALIVVFVVVGFVLWWHDNTAEVRVGAVTFQVVVADDESERQQGLGSRTAVTDGEGMLFVFPRDAQWAIWMKDMKIPIDIVWLDFNKQVIHVEQSVQPETYPARFSPPSNARYVLELTSGMVEKAAIKPGVTVQFNVSAATK